MRHMPGTETKGAAVMGGTEAYREIIMIIFLPVYYEKGHVCCVVYEYDIM